MSFFELLSDALSRGESSAPRTLCCNVPMFDMWMHADDCPNANATRDKIKAWRAANPNVPLTQMPRSVDVPPLGSHSSMCPHCGFPTGFFGIYVVGEKCSWCGYLENRIP